MSRSHLRFFNLYLTTTISVAMVLFLVGMLATLLLASQSLLTRVKENVALTIVLSDQATEDDMTRFAHMLDAAPYCKSYRYISKQEALEEHIANLGEDPTLFLGGYNPLKDAYEVHPTAEYAHPDSVAILDAQLCHLPYIDHVIYQRDLLELMNHNFSKAAIALLAAALMLLIIALALIINTIRLQIYAKRFIINTMSLVGATSWMIRAPFVKRNVGIGIAAAMIALAFLAGAMYYIFVRLHILLFALTWQNITFLVGIVLCSGILITMLAALFSTGKYVRMKTDTLYRI